ncbi:hypothetical protein MHL31_03890 [Lutibacter sp. A80]|uniref:hypothetical protein n=1 Tax=Lutibacter sp. A80 TaxID=2918453 RepID=UPI001F055421|nr:hypothetical protein [Lutibacter sp. A80]UMB61350.1 hypothetical protein MHL31_03890 [Lutibacter sp. A80]
MNNKEIHKMTPILDKMVAKKHGFSVPEAYFNTIEDGVFAEIITSKINVNKTNFKAPNAYFDTVEENIISKLKTYIIKKETAHSVPEGYFETLEDQVLNKIKTTSKVRTLKKVSKYIAPLAIAASFLLIFILNNTQDTITFDNLTTSEIEDFIDNDMLHYDAESLAAIFPEVSLDDLNYTETIPDADVVNYLNENDIDALLLEN